MQKGNTLACVTQKPKDFKVMGLIAQIIAVGLSFLHLLALLFLSVGLVFFNGK